MSGAPQEGGYDWAYAILGARASLSLAGFVMACSFMGYGAFLRSVEFPLGWGILTNLAIWALPGQVVFADMWAKGAGLAATALAVTLTAVRLLPMAVLVLAWADVPGAPRAPRFIAAHLTAVTLWVMSNRYGANVPVAGRIPWLIGLGCTLMLAMAAVTATGYHVAGVLPLPVAAMLVFFTPAFFLFALMASARWRFDWLAIVLGAAIGPAATVYAPQFDLLIAGIGGGSLAMLLAPPRPGESR